jgi:Protein of unknown function (DUF2950)
MEALKVSQALIDAEKEYYAEAHSYTNKFVRTGHGHDGLYWPSADAQRRSPIGRYLAQAGVDGDNPENHEPFHGYNFAIVAFPAKYRTSGVMTLVMDQNGEACEKRSRADDRLKSHWHHFCASVFVVAESGVAETLLHGFLPRLDGFWRDPRLF